MPARNDQNFRRARRHAMRLGAIALVYVAATAMAARKEPPGVQVTQTGFTIVEPTKVDGATRADYARAAELLAQQRYADGIKLLQEITAKHPTLTAAHVDLGIAYAKTDALEQAEASLKRALELQPRHPIAWNELGLVQRRLGKLAEARASYEKSLAAAPGFHFARLNLAVLCDLYLGDAACALDNYLLYQQAVPDDKQAAGWIANARARAGKETK
ncbi:tetratricopeptide repeat protein [Lysobacter sp. LF1]|uniref:Tetratricopeptide repeat protein n=1 Tax=Lysobacter stagni TaxID=3045172 RepID=A0ABT6XBX2_9GAMM|nr:tetratricopeptide repeat protein [Lysobacter sp. LF1]MDI9237640.1 tetratricopeptide repeat protein [Lysobacter sp. LF1]